MVPLGQKPPARFIQVSQLMRVLAHAGDIAYVRRVANHVLLKDDPRRGL